MSELDELAEKMSTLLGEEDIERVVEGLGYVSTFNRSTTQFGWVYPDGAFHENLPKLADIFREVVAWKAPENT